MASGKLHTLIGTILVIILVSCKAADTPPTTLTEPAETTILDEVVLQDTQSPQAPTQSISTATLSPIASPTEPPTPTPIPDPLVIGMQNAGQVEQLALWGAIEAGKISAIAWSPDGETLAAAGSKRIMLHDGQSLEPLQAFNTFGPAEDVAFAREGEILVGTVERADDEGSILFWETATGTLLQELDVGKYFAIFAISPDGSTLAVKGEGKAVDIWDVDSGQVLRTLETPVTKFDYGYLSRLVIGPDGARLTAFFSGGFVAVTNIYSGEQTGLYIQNQTNLHNGCLFYGIAGDILPFLCEYEILGQVCMNNECHGEVIGVNQAMNLWSVKREGILQAYTTDPLGNIAYNPDQGTYANTIYQAVEIVNPVSGEVVKLGGAYGYNMAFNPGDGGRTLAENGTSILQLWDTENGDRLAEAITLLGGTDIPFVLLGSAGGVPVSALRDEGNPGTILINEINAEDESLKIDAQEGRITGMDISPNGQYLLASGEDNTIKFFDLDPVSSKPVSTIQLDPDDPIYYGSFSADSSTYLTLQKGMVFRLWEVQSGHELSVLDLDAHGYYDISGDLGTLGTIADGEEKELLLWDIQDGESVGSLDLPDGVYRPVPALSHDGSLFALGKQDLVHLFDVQKGEELFTMGQGEAKVADILFSPDQCSLAVGKSNGEIQLWDLSTRQIMQMLEGHSDAFAYFGFSVDGHLLFSASFDGTVRLWGVQGAESAPLGSLPGEMCGIPPYMAPTPTATVTPIPTMTPTATPPVYQRTLYLESPLMTGDDVLQLQLRLIDLGYLDAGTADGIFGPMTDEAVRLFQEVYGLEVDGFVGPLTWERLFSQEAIGVND